MALRYVALVALCAVAGCGESQARGEGPTLYLAGDHEMWTVDVGSGHVRHDNRADLAPGVAPHRVLARGRSLVIGAPYGTRAFFLPSARRDRVWVVDLRRDGTVL